MKVTIEEAKKLQNEGKMVPNPRFGMSKDEPKQVFRATYMVWWRPELPSKDSSRDYAMIEKV